MKKHIFISHATPDDNEFSVWLATKLELCGYTVWVDKNELNPSDDFWLKIESALRNDTIKFIFVASKISITRDGVKKELAVADRLRRDNPTFITPVRIDDLAFNEFPIEILRLQTIDFKDNWGLGLSQLIKSLEKEGIPKEAPPINSRNVVERWRQVFTAENSCLSARQETYHSNLHQLHLPQYLYAYGIEAEKMLKERRIPYKSSNGIVMTFACNKCMSAWIGREIQHTKINPDDVTEKYCSTVLLGKTINDIDYHIISLVNWNMQKIFYAKYLFAYKSDANSKKKVFFFQDSSKHKARNAKRAKKLSGNYLSKKWHFGISAYHVRTPAPGILFRWHLIFSDGKGNILPQHSQIKGRRSKGKRFFNKDWKDLLFTAVDYLANNTEYIRYSNCCDENEMRIAATPFVYSSDVGYIETEDINLETEESSLEELDG